MAVNVLTFGCRLNAGESEVIRREALTAGLSDTVVVNTCAVTAEAVRQCRQTVRRIKRERPQTRIVVTGCAAQIDPASFAAMPEVALVVGNDEKLDVSTWSKNWRCTREHLQSSMPACSAVPAEEKIKVNDIMSLRETAAHLIGSLAGRVRSFVQVQNGCDHRCTFCIIPYGRGNSRSVPMGEVVAQVRSLCERGCREVVLTGVDLTSYGSNLPGAPKLATLVRQILKHVPELPRLRLSSIDSVEADRELLDALANESRLMPHLHLSLQAGDDLILKRMKRRHSRADAMELLHAGSPFAAGYSPRRRSDRGVSHRERGYVCTFAGAHRCMRAYSFARLSFLVTAGHAGRAHASGRRAGDKGACTSLARKRRGGPKELFRGPNRGDPSRADDFAPARPYRAVYGCAP